VAETAKDAFRPGTKLPPKGVRQEVLDILGQLSEEIVTETEHAKERQHLASIDPGKPATELQSQNVRGDIGGWISGSARTHPAGSKLNKWAAEAAAPGSAFRSELTDLLNKHSIEFGVGVPDFILAHYLVRAIENLSGLQYSNRKWSSND
jgi:hypothetical protein